VAVGNDSASVRQRRFVDRAARLITIPPFDRRRPRHGKVAVAQRLFVELDDRGTRHKPGSLSGD
jgi:hypothetical protein